VLVGGLLVAGVVWHAVRVRCMGYRR
jgi:hypothetical protein